MIETSLWYPSTGEGSDCPADPDGFARHLKSKTTTPGPGAQAPTLRTRYRYRTLAALPGNTQDQSWHVVDEELLEQMTGEQASTLQSIQHTYYDDSNDAFIHGRLHSQALTMNGLTTMTRYAYALGTATGFGSDQAEQTVLSIEQTVMGHEYDPDNEALKGVYKITRSERSLLTGEPLLSEDEEGTKMHFVYDVLGRLVSETVAPTTQYAATRTYSYTLCAVDRDRAQQQLTTSHGVTMITYLDGLTRLVREARDHIDDTSDATRKQAFDIRHIEYDTQGRQTTTTQFDYNGATRLTQLTQHSTYDHWGHQNCVTLPDGTQQHTDTELHGPGGYKGRIVQTWRQAAGKDGATSSKRKQWINLFDKPERTQRLGTAGTATEVERFEYDGLGQCVVQRDAYGYKTLNTYDAFGRVTQVRLPDNTRVLRDYAAHSPQTLAAAIRVMAVAPPGVAGTPVTLGTRVHDGVGRLKSTTAGMRTETLDYPAGKSLANRRTTAAARAVDLSYNPQLTDSPTAITVEDTYQSDFAFDDVRATLVSATNEHGQRRYAYDWNNRLKLEEWCVDGTCVFKREKQFSSAGRALLQTATGSLATQWQYDDHGRLHSVRQGAFSVNVSYDPLGRPNRFEVEQSGAATPVATTVISYDEHDREVSRTLKLERQAERTLQQTWGPGDLLRHRELMEGQTLLLQETFGYDERKRLTTLKYRGQKQPKDELGRTIKHQTFLYDPYDNIFYCRNEFANADAEHTLFLAAPDDPCQLKEIVYIPPRYKQPLPLSYTQDGHLQRDELGRTMIYDALGHLQQVTAEDALGRSNSTYRYDALGQLLATQHDANEETLLVFEENRLSFAIRGASKTQWLRALGTPFAQQTGDDILLLQTNANVSVISEATHDTRSDTSYLAYGGHYPLAQGASLLGFNGEYIDPATGWYLLGSGYRALNPKQLRFNSPDSMSPFDGGGLSCYGYANANPIAFNDPTGHSAQGIASASDYQQSSSAQGIELTSAYESEAQRYLRYQSMEFERQQQAAREKAKNDLFIKGGLSLLLSIASLGIGAVGSAPAFITLMNLIGTALNASSLAVSAAALTTSDEKLIRAADVMDYVSIGLGIVDLTSTFASLSKSPLIASKVAATAVAASRRSSSASLLSQPAATMQRRSSASGALSYMEASAPPEPSAPPGTSSRNLGGRPSISSVSGSGSARPSIIPSQIRSAESQA
ncbi:RHS repeat-associated core domain-containing protein [Pseudomonas sp. UFMG81]|uniref:RHS repeat-associated core domain-containing protein n=1 Tax=Pseudomonas sp. UFMG81 TaxID=2745936 RepID=UPI00188F250A|nr:RHS repeat-associated core domain-containing protein [Pseudomonas sp. UFMG81]